MSDPRIIPLLDPEPTEQERQHCTEGWARNTAAERVLIARQAIEWVHGNNKCSQCGSDLFAWQGLLNKLAEHDAAIAERGKK